MRQVVLDTETTGLEPKRGHRIIEIGCVELINRKLTGRHYHQYICPEREVDAEAVAVHGLTDEFLTDKPLFADIAQAFVDFVSGAQLIIHNAPFDVGFINHEFAKLKPPLQPIEKYCGVLDSLALARNKHPGQKNNLDALCRRYYVDNSQRDLHGALLDSEILADVYLLMTGGQTKLALGSGSQSSQDDGNEEETDLIRRVSQRSLRVIRANEDEVLAHQKKLERIGKVSGGSCVWLQGKPGEQV